LLYHVHSVCNLCFTMFIVFAIHLFVNALIWTLFVCNIVLHTAVQQLSIVCSCWNKSEGWNHPKFGQIYWILQSSKLVHNWTQQWNHNLLGCFMPHFHSNFAIEATGNTFISHTYSQVALSGKKQVVCTTK